MSIENYNFTSTPLANADRKLLGIQTKTATPDEILFAGQIVFVSLANQEKIIRNELTSQYGNVEYGLPLAFAARTNSKKIDRLLSLLPPVETWHLAVCYQSPIASDGIEPHKDLL